MNKYIVLSAFLSVLMKTAFAQRTDRAERVTLRLKSIEIGGDTLFLKLHLANQSLVIYHWDDLRVYARDRHQPKRTALQETEFDALSRQDLPEVGAHTDTSLSVPYNAFTISPNKLLIIKVAERDGRRGLTLRVTGRRFMHLLRKKINY